MTGILAGSKPLAWIWDMQASRLNNKRTAQASKQGYLPITKTQSNIQSGVEWKSLRTSITIKPAGTREREEESAGDGDMGRRC